MHAESQSKSLRALKEIEVNKKMVRTKEELNMEMKPGVGTRRLELTYGSLDIRSHCTASPI